MNLSRKPQTYTLYDVSKRPIANLTCGLYGGFVFIVFCRAISVRANSADVLIHLHFCGCPSINLAHSIAEHLFATRARRLANNNRTIEFLWWLLAILCGAHSVNHVISMDLCAAHVLDSIGSIVIYCVCTQHQRTIIKNPSICEVMAWQSQQMSEIYLLPNKI